MKKKQTVAVWKILHIPGGDQFNSVGHAPDEPDTKMRPTLKGSHPKNLTPSGSDTDGMAWYGGGGPRLLNWSLSATFYDSPNNY